MGFKVDLNKAKQAKQEIDSKNASFGNTSSVKWYKMEGKKVRLRFLPAWTDEGPFALQPWRVVAQHWNVNEDSRGPILCPKQTPHLGGECPICDFVDALKARDNDPEALEMVKAVKAKQAYLFTVIDMDDPVYTTKDVKEWTKARPDKECPFADGDAKLQVYAAPFTVYSNIINILEMGTDIFDIEEGHDIQIEKTSAGRDQFTKYTVTPVLKPTNVSKIVDPDHELVALDKVGFVNTFEKLNELLEGGVKGAFEEGVGPVSMPTKALPAKASKPVTAAKAKKVVQEEVEEDEDLNLGGDTDDEDLSDLERLMEQD